MAAILTEDTPTHRRTVLEMTDIELEDELDRIRERRLRMQRVYEEAMRAKSEARVDKLRIMLEKQCGMLDKELTRLDTLTTKISERITKIRAIRIEHGDEAAIAGLLAER